MLAAENGDLNPDYEVLQPRLNKGSVRMKSALSRKKLSAGRPSNEPNVSATKTAQG
jgi:hypothetical protein